MEINERYAIGVDLGGTNIKVGIVSEYGEIIKKASLDTKADKGPDVVLSQIKKGIRELLSENKSGIVGIGIGLPGVIDIDKGIVQDPPNLSGWKKVKVGEIINKEFGLEVHVENDANAAALGEMYFGNGKKLNSFIMVTLGTGVGGGIIYNRNLFRGESGAAGEIGHVTINYSGQRCNCGSYGCIESFIGNNYLISKVKKLLPKHPGSLIWKSINNDFSLLTPVVIQNALEEGDEFASSVVNDMGLHLGTAFASVSNLLDINTFIIGGGVAGFGKPLFEVIEKTMKSRVLTPLRNKVKIIPAKLRNNAGVKGASALVFYRTGNQ